MNRMTTIAEERELVEFAERAALNFEVTPQLATFGDPRPGGYLALRWGLRDDCVLVVKIDEFFEPVNFQQAIRKPT